jgi:hypothetical protein
MKSKFIIAIVLFGIASTTYSQNKIQFVQIAFEYYRDSILKDYQLKKKLTISKTVVEDCAYWNVKCLKEFDIKIGDTAAAVVSAIGTNDLNLWNDERFKLIKFKKKKPPMIFATAFASFDTDKYIVGIVENLEGMVYTYLFEITSEGKIRKWCKDRFIED